MIEYHQNQEFALDKVWFDFQGGRYEGRGLLRWEPEKGFHLDAFPSVLTWCETTSVVAGHSLHSHICGIEVLIQIGFMKNAEYFQKRNYTPHMRM